MNTPVKHTPAVALVVATAAAAAGVDCFVAGSAVYNAADPGAAVEALRRQAAAASPHLVL